MRCVWVLADSIVGWEEKNEEFSGVVVAVRDGVWLLGGHAEEGLFRDVSLDTEWH